MEIIDKKKIEYVKVPLKDLHYLEETLDSLDMYIGDLQHEIYNAQDVIRKLQAPEKNPNVIKH